MTIQIKNDPIEETRQELIRAARIFAYASTSTGPRGKLPKETRFNLDAYEPRIYGKHDRRQGFCCPHCAVREGRKDAWLTPGWGTNDYDVLVCSDRSCGAEFILGF